MTALPLPLPGSSTVGFNPAPYPDEPVALLQLDASDPVEAASAVYREIRRGRRVVAVAGGDSDASARLTTALDAIGVATSRPGPGEAVVGPGVTVVAGPAFMPDRPRPGPARVLRVGLAGCGVVGGGVLSRLLGDPRFEVVGVLVRDSARPRDVVIPARLALSDPAALLAREPDILVEAISDASTGLALIRAALARGATSNAIATWSGGATDGGSRQIHSQPQPTVIVGIDTGAGWRRRGRPSCSAVVGAAGHFHRH